MSEYQDISVSVEEIIIQADITEDVIAVAVNDTVIAANMYQEVIEAGLKEEVIEVILGADEIHVSLDGVTAEGGGALTGGYVFVTDVTTSGIAGSKVYQEETVPANAVLLSLTVDEADCEVFFQAEGGENYSPVISIGGVECTNLQEIAEDSRLFTGSIPINVTESSRITLISSTDQFCYVQINRAALAPEILSCLIGDLPGVQTAVKSGDVVTVTGTVEATATHVKLNSYGAFNTSGWISCSGGTYSITGTVSGQSGLKNAQVIAKNLLGSEGTNFVSSNQITLDQVYPSFTDLGITYPAGQAAFKDSETGSQETVVNSFDTLVYSSNNSDFTISDTTTYAQDKTIQFNDVSHYNDSTNNFRIIAHKIANDSNSTFTKNIEVANVAPVVTVTQPNSRLRSSNSGTSYTITASSNQNLAAAPQISVPVSGVWQGSGFSGGPKTYTRSITINDAHTKGIGAWALVTAVTNRAGIVATISGSQNVGGFRSRNIALPAFASTVELSTAVVTTSKLVFSWTAKSPMNFQSIGTAPPVVSGWTIDAVGINPTSVIILDLSAAAASSQESTITVEESV